MKKVLFLCLIFISSVSYSAYIDDVDKTSFTITNDGPVLISSATAGSVLRSVIISSGAPNFQIKIYDSKGTAVNQISNLSGSGTADNSKQIIFDVRISSGITYTIVGNNAGGVTFIYRPAPGKF